MFISGHFHVLGMRKTTKYFSCVVIKKLERQSFTLWQQAAIEITRRDHTIIACSRHIYLCVAVCAHPCLWWIALSTQHQLRGCNNVPSFLQWTAPIAHSFCEGCTWHHLHILVKPLYCDWKAQAASMQSFISHCGSKKQ